MQHYSRNSLLVSLVKDEKQNQEARNKEYNVAGAVHPLRPEMRAKGYIPIGSTVEFAIKEACKSAGVRKSYIKRGIAQIGTRNFETRQTVWRHVPMDEWKTRKLEEGELLRFRLLPAGGGGGGGKSPLRTILTIVVAVLAISAAVAVPQLGIFAGAEWFGLSAAATSSLIGGMAGLAVSTIGMVLVNAIAPIKGPSIKGISQNTSESKVYGISAGKNTINQYGRVPVPLGRGRFAPPKAASPYTQTNGEDIVLHELLCPGIGDLDLSKFKIGTTNIEEFLEVEWEAFKYDPANPTSSKLYPTGVYQEDLNIELKEGQRNTRTTNVCDKIEIDFSFNGLCWINDDNSKSTRSVSFLVQYRKASDDPWSTVAEPKYVYGSEYVWNAINVSPGTLFVTVSKSSGIRFSWNSVSIPEDGMQLAKFNYTIVEGSGGYLTKDGWYLTKVEGIKPNPKLDYSGFSVGYSDVRTGIGAEMYVSVSGGTLSNKTDLEPPTSLQVTYSGAQTRLLRKTFTINPPERGRYEVSVIRVTPDSTNDRLINASYWGAVRSVSSDLPVQTDYPINLIALRIKASGQLSGAIDTFTTYYEAKVLDWDENSGQWTKRYSSNPASIFRHVLQDKDAYRRPQEDKIIDLESLKEAHAFWKDKGWSYNFVCDADAGVFERLQSICAAGLASPTMIDGKWAIIIDKPRDSVACAFTSANAWGWKFSRTQVRLPNAIHCSFQNEATWNADMRVVPTDEKVGTTYLHETQSYEGVTNPDQIYQLARFHYGDAKVRRRTISFRCYDEALICTRGDLVDCAAPNVSPQGLQVGRIRKIERNEFGDVVALYTDQQQATDFSGRRFGVKVYARSGAIFHAEVLPENVAQRKLTLFTPQPMGEGENGISPGDKYAFGDYSEETFPAIVLGMRPNPDFTFDMILQDYTPQLYGRLEEPIPDFESIITVPITGKWEIFSLPVIERIATDESALLMTYSGTVPRILVTYSHPVDLDARAIGISFDVSLAGKNVWTSAAKNVSLQESEIYISGVIEGELYDIRARYNGASGETGKFIYSKNVKIIGRTTPPPPPSGVFLNGSTLLIQQSIRPLDVVGHKVFMVMDEEDTIHTAIELTNPYTVTGTFELKPWAGKARAVFVRTVDEIGLMSTPVRVVVDLGDIATRNILFEFSERNRLWNGEISGGYVASGTLFSDESAGFYAQNDEEAYYPQHDSSAAYPSGTASTLIYTWKVEIPQNYRNARVIVLLESLSGRLQSLVFRHYTDVARYGDDLSSFYSQDDNQGFYPQPDLSEWEPMPEEYITPGAETLEMRVTYANTEVAQISDIKTILDVEDREHEVKDLLVESSGLTRIPIPSGFFRSIVMVVSTIQYEEGDTVMKVPYVKGSETLDMDGYVELGPYVRAYDANNNLTSANCDFIVRGF